jgi:hypothetical protein
MVDLKTIPKKIQYISIESNFVEGTNNSCAVNFDFDSNILIENMKDVVGVRLVDFYVTQVGEDGSGAGDVAKLIDIICPDIPMAAQILDARQGTVFARIPIERSTSNLVVHDKQWKGQPLGSTIRFFNPISIKKLHFDLFELRGNNSYTRLQPDATWFMTLEIHTLDHEAPKPDKLAIAIDKLSEHISKMPPPQLVMPAEPKQKIPLYMVLIPVSIVAFAVFYMKKMTPGATPDSLRVNHPVFIPPPTRR